MRAKAMEVAAAACLLLPSAVPSSALSFGPPSRTPFSEGRHRPPTARRPRHRCRGLGISSPSSYSSVPPSWSRRPGAAADGRRDRLLVGPIGSVARSAIGGPDDHGDDDDDDCPPLDVGLRFRTTSRDLSRAALVGTATGLSVAIFKAAVDLVLILTRRATAAAAGGGGRMRRVLPLPPLLLPALGGLAVGLLSTERWGGRFPPGLRDTVRVVDSDGRTGYRRPKGIADRVAVQIGAVRKSIAAAFTLGTGNSLGPEGPCVEIGMSVARAWVDGRAGPSCGMRSRSDWNRLLLACGAAGGVAAGFDAPFSGVFFALEVMRGAFTDVDAEGGGSGDGDTEGTVCVFSTTADVTPVILSSVLSALVTRAVLGEHQFLFPADFSLPMPLAELPLFVALGAVSGFVAFAFGHMAKLSRSAFAGNLGGRRFRSLMASVPPNARPALGGLTCGVIGVAFPQVLFFGHETVNALLGNTPLPTLSLLALLAAKILSTAAAAGSGLVGGTFAPALFMGAVAGGAFHNIISGTFLSTLRWVGGTAEMTSLPAYAMVGSASVLAALFRAPLTASLLLFELTKDQSVILPLMASAGVGSMVGDILDDKIERSEERRRDRDEVSWGDLADKNVG